MAERGSVLTGPRTYAREIARGDAEFLLGLFCGDDEHAFMEHPPRDADEARAFIEWELRYSLKEERKRYFLILCEAETDEPLGITVLTLSPSLPTGVIGYALLPRFRGRGFAREGVSALLRFAFMGLDLHRVSAECDEENAASLRVLESVGMRREGLLVKARRLRYRGHECWRSVYVYGMLQKEYLMRLPDGDYSPSVT